ncbi:unnamed protein product [Arabidopsis thaliana]|uniref:Uncharacterized protein n=1 Tax=Arabidopsis thaliana TaxID=3702 RepID=A0A654ESM5_ARATH|nr:unnamed protein product [Arabidopsis thaliana]
MGESSRQAEEEASKRKTTQDGQKESDKRSQKQKVSELKEGGILKPPKKRSDMNSQSQLSDDSFPAPLTPPFTVPTPPLNLAELAATRLELFPPTTVTSSQKLMVHRPQVGIQAQQRRPNSQVSPLTEEEDTSRFSRIVETGESSRRVEWENLQGKLKKRHPRERLHKMVRKSLIKEAKNRKSRS